MARNGYVLVHGAWHNKDCWAKVSQILTAAGHLVDAIDLPGAGKSARFPASFFKRPFDAAAFAAELSNAAEITQAERTAAVVDAVKKMNARTGGQSILVGHSLGGLSISPAGQEIPEAVKAVVYVSAILLPNGMAARDITRGPEMTGVEVPKLLIGNDVEIGARRINPASKDDAYLSLMKSCFYQDVDQSTFDHLRQSLHTDEPISVSLEPSNVTASKFGNIPRHYVECLQDRAIPVAVQRKMVAIADQYLGTKTTTRSLDVGHSPFVACPDELSEILMSI